MKLSGSVFIITWSCRHSYLVVLVCDWTESGNRCGNFSLPAAETQLWTFPEDLIKIKTMIVFVSNNSWTPLFIEQPARGRLTDVDVSRRQLPSRPKMNSDEFSLKQTKTQIFWKSFQHEMKQKPSPQLQHQTSNPRYWTHKARGVVISNGFGVSKRLHGRICFDDLILQRALKTITDQSHSGWF